MERKACLIQSEFTLIFITNSCIFNSSGQNILWLSSCLRPLQYETSYLLYIVRMFGKSNLTNGLLCIEEEKV